MARWHKKTADYRTTEYAIQKLQQDYDQPFFLNVGIYKPHSPFFAPQEFFDKYPLHDLEVPELLKDDCNDFPEGARKLMEKSKWFWSGMMKAMDDNPNAYREYIQAYQACATFADDMIGKIIDAW